jgi:hypothetical protein
MAGITLTPSPDPNAKPVFPEGGRKNSVSDFKVVVTKVSGVRAHGDNLTIVTLDGIENEVVANLREDGAPRWLAGETCVYVPEGAVIPDDVLKERGYWTP